jgi:gliding motility-associated-like protein
MKYILKLSLITLISFGLSLDISGQTPIPVCGPMNSFTGMTRGYHFTAPTNFTICGLYVEDDVSTLFQSVAIVRFTAGAPGAFPATTNAFVTLFQNLNYAPNNMVAVPNVVINAGDIIGIYGSRGANSVNSYGAPNCGLMINGFPTTAQRSGMQFDLAAGPGMHDIWSEVNYNIGRVTMYTNCCPNPTAVPGITGPLTVCQNDTVTYSCAAQTGALSYNWVVPAGATIVSGQGTNTISVVWTAGPGGQICVDWTDACATSPQTCVNVTVSPVPTMTTPTNITVCNGDNVPAGAFVSNPAGGTFTWTNSDPTIGLAASGTGNTPAFTATNNGATPVVATITVTPTVGGCLGTPITYTITVNPTPPAPTALSVTTCPNNNTTLTATAPGGNYEWYDAPTGGNLLIANASYTTPNLTTTTTYYVQTTVNGCVSPRTAVTVTVANLLIADAGLDDTICSGTPYTLIANPNGPTYSYNWDELPGNLGFSTIFNPTVSPAAQTTYALTIVDSNNCVSMDSVTLFVHTTPTMTAPPNDTVCNAGATMATNFVSNPAGGTFTWTNSNPAIGLAASGTGNIPSFNGVNGTNAAITSTITVTPTANGCPGTPITYTVTVNPGAQANVPGSFQVCPGDVVNPSNFTSTPMGGTFAWTNSNPGIGLAASGTGNLPQFNAINNGSTPVTATISVIATASGCPGVASTYTITVNPITTGSTNVAICQGDSMLIGGSYYSTPGTYVDTLTGSLGCDSVLTYNLTVNIVTISNTNVTICNGDSILLNGNYYNTAGTYPFTFTSVHGCDSIVVYELAIDSALPATILAAPSTSINLGETVALQAFTGQSGTTYSWTPPYGLSCDFCPSPLATPTESTWYYVTTTNPNGCQRIDSIYIEVDPSTNLYVPNIFSPNGDGNNDVYKVRGKGVELFNLKIFNRWGQVVFESESIDEGWDGTKGGSMLNQGVFVYKLNVTMYNGDEYKETGNITLVR